MTAYIGAIDQGTTSTRFIVFDKRGNIISVAQKEHEQIYPKPGWVEHDADEILANTKRSLAKPWRRRPSPPPISPPSASPTSAKPPCCGTADRPALYNALVWQDTRVEDAGRRICAGRWAGPLPRENRPASRDLFQRSEARWLLDNVPGARQKAEAGEADFWHHRFLPGLEPHWRHQGGMHITDVTNASRTQLMDLKPCDGTRTCCHLYDIPARCCRRSARLAKSMATAQTRRWRACRSPAFSATSKPRWLARPVSSPARPRTPTAPAASC